MAALRRACVAIQGLRAEETMSRRTKKNEGEKNEAVQGVVPSGPCWMMVGKVVKAEGD